MAITFAKQWALNGPFEIGAHEDMKLDLGPLYPEYWHCDRDVVPTKITVWALEGDAAVEACSVRVLANGQEIISQGLVAGSKMGVTDLTQFGMGHLSKGTEIRVRLNLPSSVAVPFEKVRVELGFKEVLPTGEIRGARIEVGTGPIDDGWNDDPLSMERV